MFDDKSEIGMPAPARVGGNLLVRWPTDAEWAARSRARKFITRHLGRGLRETVTPPPGDGDLKLYQAISLNGSPSLSAAEASMVLEAMCITIVTNVEVDGNEACVTMNVLTGEVQHRLRVPTADEIFEYKRAAFKQLDLPYGQAQTSFTPEAGARVYDQCNGKSGPEYYKGAIPGPHKAEAVRAVIDHIEHHMGPATDDPNS
jgi:hypothetical protein